MQRKIGLIEILHHLFQTYLKRVQDIAHLASLEARLAGRTLVIILALFFVLACLVISSWLSVNALLFMGLLALKVSAVMTAGIMLVFNLLSLVFVWLIIVKIKKNLTFPATRKHLHFPDITEVNLEIPHEKTSKRNRKHRKSNKA